jgi:cellulose synthase/poly-beta-1,6-N-acetylglucosamine synthase-like glycosyltransferase
MQVRSEPLSVAVVVPVRDLVGAVESCAGSLEAQDWHGARIVFVDNGSRDGSAELLARRGHEVLSEPRRGAAAARNRGIEATTEEIVAFTDADCVVSTSWLRELLAAFTDPEIEVASGTLLPLEPWRSAYADYAAQIGQYDARRTLSHPLFPYAPPGNVAIRRRVLAEVGGFDPEFQTYEGAELFYRIHRAGRLRYEVRPRAAVFFRTRDNLSAFLRQNQAYGRGWAQFGYKHPEAFGGGRRWVGTSLRRLAAGRALPPRLWALHVVRELALLGGALGYRLSSGVRER